jgi:hypothetical protein
MSIIYILLGCEVHAYDHTIPGRPSTKYNNIHYKRLGIGTTNNGLLKTLDYLIGENGHTTSVINYLKVSKKLTIHMFYSF